MIIDGFRTVYIGKDELYVPLQKTQSAPIRPAQAVELVLVKGAWVLPTWQHRIVKTKNRKGAGR